MKITFNQQSLDLSAPKIMGILNLTPNSFSDGGDYFSEYYDPEKALNRAYEMIEDGADILDIGAESTNPKAEPITSEEEIKRLLPVIRKLKQHIKVPISIDTFRANTMRAMVDEGIDIINDVTALSDPGSLEVLVNSQAAIVLMHMLGNHEKMHLKGDYSDQGGITKAVLTKLHKKAELCLSRGIESSRIILDPGFGFDKTPEDQLSLLKELDQLTSSPYPYLVGVSRKRFIGTITKAEIAKDRLAGNLAVALWSIQKGAKILRVHDVKETKQAFLMWEAMNNAADSQVHTQTHPKS